MAKSPEAPSTTMERHPYSGGSSRSFSSEKDSLLKLFLLDEGDDPLDMVDHTIPFEFYDCTLHILEKKSLF